MRPPAWMVELVDTTDLKSVDPKGRAGSSPAPGTKREIAAMRSPVFWLQRDAWFMGWECSGTYLYVGKSHDSHLVREGFPVVLEKLDLIV